MNSKMTTNSQLLTEPKNKLNKQLEQEQNHRNGDHMEGYQWGRGWGRMGEKIQRRRNNWWVENRQEDVRNSVGNVEAKELICMTQDMN